MNVFRQLPETQFACLQLLGVLPHRRVKAAVLVEASDLGAQSENEDLVVGAEFLGPELVGQRDPTVVVLERDDRGGKQREDWQVLQRQSD